MAFFGQAETQVWIYNMKSNYYGGKTEKIDKWSKDSEAAKFLKTALENGDIDPTNPSKTIWEQFPIFQQYGLAKFWAALNKQKSKLRCKIRRKVGGEATGPDEDMKPFPGECITVIGKFGIIESDAGMIE